MKTTMFATLVITLLVVCLVSPTPASAQWSVGQQLGQAAANVAYSVPWTVADIYRNKKQAETQRDEIEARRQVELSRTAGDLGCDVSVRTDGKTSTDVTLGGTTGNRCPGTSQERVQVAVEKQRTEQNRDQVWGQVEQTRLQTQAQTEQARIALDRARLEQWSSGPQPSPEVLRELRDGPPKIKRQQ